MKKYFISIDLDQLGIEAENEKEAYRKVYDLIQEGFYSLNIVDVEEVKE